MPRSDGSAFTPFAANVMAILVVAIFVPIVMGWGMNSGLQESLHASGPNPLIHNSTNNVDDYVIHEFGNCSIAHPTAALTMGQIRNSSHVIGSGYMGSNVTSDDTVGDFWMYRMNQGIINHNCGNGPYQVSVPMDQFINVEDNISGFYFKMMSLFRSSWQNNPDTLPVECEGDFTFNAKLIIEGEAIIEEYQITSDDCTKFKRVTASGLNTDYRYHRSIQWTPFITPIDAHNINLKIEEQGCGMSCNVTVEIDRLVHSNNGTVDDFEIYFLVQSATYEVNGEDAYRNLAISAWILGALLGVATIASTPLWDPFKNHIGKLGSYDL